MDSYTSNVIETRIKHFEKVLAKNPKAGTRVEAKIRLRELKTIKILIKER